MANISEVSYRARQALRPPPKLTLSDWADEHFYLSPESSAEAGRWKTLPYQKGILDAVTDPAIEQITVMKSARVGYTKCLNAAIAYHMAQDPCPIMLVQPTVEDAEGYSKEEIAPMIRDVPLLQDLVADVKAKDGSNTITAKTFPGGSLSMVGANSGRGFRRVSRRVVLFDEVDGYPISAGTEGDQIKLGTKRSDYYWNRKIIAGSTPLVKNASRIEKRYAESDQRRRFLPCPECGHMQFLKFRKDEDDEKFGPVIAYMKWDEGDPDSAHFICAKNGCRIEHRHKREMDARGEWRATAVGNGKHAGFHIWAAYSYSPNASWAHLVREFLDSKHDSVLLKTFVNTALGETWEEEYAAQLTSDIVAQRVEDYEPGLVPEGGVLLTAGVDVQDDRLEVRIDAWGEGEENWVVDYQVIKGDLSDLSDDGPWKQLDEVLFTPIPHVNGVKLKMAVAGLDTGGHYTHEAYEYARTRKSKGVIALKGSSQRGKPAIGKPSPQDINLRGKPLIKGGVMLYSIGTDTIKSLVYGRLKHNKPGPGYMHFHNQLKQEFFDQLTVEKKIMKLVRGQPTPEWVKPANARNEALDTTVYSYAALQFLMTKYARKTIFDQFKRKLESLKAEKADNKTPQAAPLQKPAPARKMPARRPGKGWVNKW